jgi:hypothetical protein
MSGNSEAAQRWFARYPLTQDWLANGEGLPLALTNTEGPTRKCLFAVSTLLGHSAPNVTLEHYTHVLDIIGTAEIQNWREHPYAVLASASKLAPSTARRSLDRGWNELVLRHWGKSSRADVAEDTWSSALGDSDLITQGPEDWPRLSQLTFATNIVNIGSDRSSIHRIERDLGWSNERAIGFYENSHCLFGLYEGRPPASPAAKQCGHPLSQTTPQTQLLKSEWKIQDESSVWLYKKLWALSQSNPTALDQLLSDYARLSHRKPFHVVLKSHEDISLYTALTDTLGIPRNRINLEIMVGSRSDDTWVRRSKRIWRAGLGLLKNLSLKEVRTNDSLTVGSHGWIGLKVLEDFVPRSDRADRKSLEQAKASQVFPFVMNNMVLGKGVFW